MNRRSPYAAGSATARPGPLPARGRLPVPARGLPALGPLVLVPLVLGPLAVLSLVLLSLAAAPPGMGPGPAVADPAAYGKRRIKRTQTRRSAR
ncbi:hypothetical protein AB0N23_18225, partial [Streptomyces sp. NPDC052644]